MPSFVQFIHPGGEHGQDSDGRKGWNVGDHRRKFMRVDGRYIERPGARPVADEVVFWGEWEPESEVAAIANRAPGGPRWLHRPYYVRLDAYRGGAHLLQNTDPFVFGDRFLYTLCRQWRGSSERPTVLRDLPSGSLILFGSLRGGAFILDTVLVADAGVLHDSETWPSVLESHVCDTYKAVTMQPTCEWGAEKNVRLRLYSGATPAKPIHGMFSFAPCLPALACASGFSRPPIRLDGFVSPGLMTGFKAHHNLPPEQLKHLWGEVVAQVTDHRLVLGTWFELPRRRDA